MKIIILGSTGILGKTLGLFLSKNKSREVFYISRRKRNKNNFYLKDFTNIKKLQNIIIKIKPTHIVNCVGVTKFNSSYNKKKITNLINTELPKKIGLFCNLNKIYFIHISTDCVFSGNRGNYSENSYKDSVDLYGISKSRGELKNKYTSTIRTSFIGPETLTSKSLLSWFLNQKKQVRGFNNAFFSGITSLELSKIIYKYFLKKNNLFNKLINVGGKRISKYNLLIHIKKVYSKNINIIKYSNFSIDRSLNSNKFQTLTGYKFKNWEILLEELKKFMSDNKFKY